MSVPAKVIGLNVLFSLTACGAAVSPPLPQSRLHGAVVVDGLPGAPRIISATDANGRTTWGRAEAGFDLGLDRLKPLHISISGDGWSVPILWPHADGIDGALEFDSDNVDAHIGAIRVVTSPEVPRVEALTEACIDGRSRDGLTPCSLEEAQPACLDGLPSYSYESGVAVEARAALPMLWAYPARTPPRRANGCDLGRDPFYEN